MQKANDILNWHFSISELKFTAEHLFTQKTKSQISENITALKKLTDRLPEGGKQPETKLIKDIYFLFQKNYNVPANQKIVFTQRETRCLIWALDFQPSENDEIILFSEKYKAALSIIETYWKDSFIISLWHILLKNWDKLLNFPKQQGEIFKLLHENSKNYSRNRKDILKIASNIDFFTSTDSPTSFAVEILQKNISLGNSNFLFEQKEQILGYPYFFHVAQNYLDLIEKEQLNESNIAGVYSFLQKHNRKKATLILCSKIINEDIFNRNIEIVKKHTVALIDDPIKEYQWKHGSLNESEQQNVEKARKKLNILLNKHFIKIFFEKLVEDDRRKKYWLKFIDKIDDIKFSGNRSNFQYLKNIQSISQYVDFRYKITSRNQGTSALIIYSKNFVFVEFTDTGALYIYKKQNFNINLNAIDSMEDLKTWSTYKYACKNAEQSGYIYLNEEGRITHQGYWESRFDAWMRKYYHD